MQLLTVGKNSGYTTKQLRT